MLPYPLRYTSSYLTLLQRRSMKTLSIQRPRPSMLIATPWASRTSVKPSDVNCEP